MTTSGFGVKAGHNGFHHAILEGQKEQGWTPTCLAAIWKGRGKAVDRNPKARGFLGKSSGRIKVVFSSSLGNQSSQMESQGVRRKKTSTIPVATLSKTCTTGSNLMAPSYRFIAPFQLADSDSW